MMVCSLVLFVLITIVLLHVHRKEIILMMKQSLITVTKLVFLAGITWLAQHLSASAQNA
jgi:hypothetical protein